MFNPHIHQQQQQQQQQFHQHLRHLQQLFQQQTPPPPPPPPPQPPPAHHIPHHHGGSRPMAVPAPAPPSARMVNLCSATQTIIAPNPMLQGALLMQQMQGNMRSFAMGGQQFQQFFATGTRSSILGPVPLGVAIKTPHMGFPPRHFNPHARYYNNNDFQARQPDRKRQIEQRPALGSDSQPAASSSRDEAAAVADVSSQSSTQQPDEPTTKKQRTEGVNDPQETESSPSTEYERPAEDPDTAECIPVEDGTVAGSEAAEALEQSRAAEQVEISESSPKDEEQHNSSSQSEFAGPVSDDKENTERNDEGKREEAGDTPSKFFCYICNITCHNQQNFQSHMNGLAHQQRMMEIQHMSNACLVTLLPRVQESLQGARNDAEKRPGLQRWCATCKTHFTINVMEHRKTKEHKICSRSTSPSCTVCKQQFRTSREFVEHMQSDQHKQRMEQLLKDAGTGNLGDLDLHMCAVGADECLDSDEEETVTEENGQEGLPVQMEVTLEDITEEEEFDQDTVYGSSFVMPVAGFLCRLCNEFYHYEKSARRSHCKTRQHFENLKKYKALKVLEASALPSPAEFLCSSVDHCTKDTESPSSSSLSDPAVSNSRLGSSEAAAIQESTTTTSSTSNGSSTSPSPDQPPAPLPVSPVEAKDAEEDSLLEEAEDEEDTASCVLQEKTVRGRGRAPAKKRGRGGRRR
ncbi:cdkn1a interacting zinc finger protein 1a [Trichomycterus rosablanca]|uniref:cdkn1a interacting zinc finger protein 1a n=1 Tax=Trichomycterus rosablanca TaxID=2290929 RepID=UPI002F35C96D